MSFHSDLFATSVTHTTLELLACVMITTRFTMDIAGVFDHYNDSGPGAMALCILLDGSTLIVLGLNGAIASLMILALDRYWRIVHSSHYRKYYRRWMLYVGLFLPWLDGAATHLLPAVGTTKIVNGSCHPTAFWPSLSMEKVWSSRHESIMLLYCSGH